MRRAFPPCGSACAWSGSQLGRRVCRSPGGGRRRASPFSRASGPPKFETCGGHFAPCCLTRLGPGASSCRHHLGGAAPARRRRHVHVSRVGAGRSPVLQQCAVGAKFFLWGHLRAKIAAEMLVWAAPQEGRWHVRLFRVGPGGGALAVQCAAGAKNYQHATKNLRCRNRSKCTRYVCPCTRAGP